MADYDLPLPAADDEDVCSSLLSLYNSNGDVDDDRRRHFCAVVGAMSQEMKDHGLTLSPTAYFGAALSSLQRLLDDPDPSHGRSIDSLVSVLQFSIGRVRPPVLRTKQEVAADVVVRVVGRGGLADDTVAAGLRCLGKILEVAGKDRPWDELGKRLFGVLVGFMACSTAKLRRQSHLCLRDAMQSFSAMPAQTHASEGLASTLERFLLLAGGSERDPAEAPKGAQEVLYVLDTLKECLPYMSMKYTDSVLKYFKMLLELRQPLVTRRITDGLNALCLYPTSQVSGEVLLDVLMLLAHSVSSHDSSIDGVNSAARLLDVGIRKVYSMSREICIVKLPVVFNALKDVMASEHKEAVVASTEAFKSLINSCLDDDLIKRGVQQISSSESSDSRSGPSIIEKVCVTIESLLDYQFGDVWDLAFQVVSAIFTKLGNHASYFLRGTLLNLADMQKLPDEDFPFRKQLHECVGSALVAMGPEMFLSIVPLNVESDNLSEVNVWLFPILKQYTVGARLSYFTESIVDSITALKRKAKKFELEGRTISARGVDALVYSLWSLFPSFCNYPVDTAESFKDLDKALSSALHEDPDVRGVICSGLQLLIEQNKKVLNPNSELENIEVVDFRQRAAPRYSMEVATSNLNVLRSSARGQLTLLFGIFLNSTGGDGGSLQSTIGAISSIADKDVVSSLFRKTMRKLLTATKEAVARLKSENSHVMAIEDSSDKVSPSIMRSKLLDLASSLLPGLNAEEIDLLFQSIYPALQDSEGLVQKKAYKVLSILLKNYEENCESKLEGLYKLMVEVLPSCHFSAKRHRLECLYFLIIYSFKTGPEHNQQEIIFSFLTEIILSLKEANKKTRNRAYDILVQIGHSCANEETGGRKENLFNFFTMVAGGLASETPHMISAAVKGLARLAYEFSDLLSYACNLLPSTFTLLERKNREIVKANLGFVKVLVAKSQVDWLQNNLGNLVEGLLKWQDGSKNHFKSKVKALLEMLVQKCGLEAVKAVMPEEHMKLLTNIRKIKERKERRHGVSSEETRSQLSKATTSRLSRWNHTRIFSDFDDDETRNEGSDYMDAETLDGRKSKVSAAQKSRVHSLRSKRSIRASQSLPEDFLDQVDDEPLDLLDRQKTRSALKASELRKRKADSDDEMELDPEGRLIIHEVGKPHKKPSEAKTDSDSRSEACSQFSVASSKKSTQKRRKTSETGWAYTGKEYTSKKARGDVKRKDKLEPYAYWPLDRKMMSRRPEHRAAARKGMASVVRMTKSLEGKSASAALSLKGSKSKRTARRAEKKSK
ncbi:hypothetical protein MLD38_014233 [Melastoma candidum]|uniref:Uncharacterized protein n=1 Tax=Melastoma candidum TaxID=119954 RepID=A0ACB9RF81_9MYRT|nr:hypothetical protein MLD38_014233 [Melastoma candidum]